MNVFCICIYTYTHTHTHTHTHTYAYELATLIEKYLSGLISFHIVAIVIIHIYFILEITFTEHFSIFYLVILKFDIHFLLYHGEGITQAKWEGVNLSVCIFL